MFANNIERSILKVVCYFDIFDFPVTLMEIWKWLDQPASLSQVKRVLAGDFLAAKLESQAGFYYLAGRQSLVLFRRERYLLAHNKFKHARRIVQIIRHFPWLKAVAVSGSLAYQNPKPTGDIDILVIADSDKVWGLRWWVVSFLKIFDLRPNVKTKQNKICPSFFIDSQSSDLSFIDHYFQERHFNYWLYQFSFIYGQSADFYHHNLWLRDIFPNSFSSQNVTWRRIEDNFISLALSAVWTWLLKLDFWQKILQKIQLQIMPQNYLESATHGQEVIINNQMIKIHINSSGRDYDQLLNNKLSLLLNEKTSKDS